MSGKCDSWHETLALDSASMDAAITQHITSKMSEAELRIEEHEATTGRTCPARMSVPGATTQVNAYKLVAITGERFLTSFPSAPPPGAEPPTKRACSEGPCGHDDADEDCATPSQQAEHAAADAFVAVVNSRAPAGLSAQEVLDLARVSRLFLAEAVLQALPAYIKPMFSTLTKAEVGNLLFSLTQALHQSAAHHALLFTMYRDAWPRFARAPLSPPADGEVDHSDLQHLLTGTDDSYAPPVQHFAFLHGAAHQSGAPPGLRLLFVVGANLASASLRQEQTACDEGAADDMMDAVAALTDDYLQGHSACETLAMPYHIQSALFALLCRARRQLGHAAVDELADAVLMACAGLATQVLPLLAPSQLLVGHPIARNEHHQRAVVAARLPITRAGKPVAASSFVGDLGVAVRMCGLAQSSARPDLLLIARVGDACVEDSRAPVLFLGLASRTASALRDLATAAQHWCDRPQAAGGLSWNHSFRVAHGDTQKVSFVPEAGHRPQVTGHGLVLPHRECAALGYEVADQEEVVVFVCCKG